MSSNNDDQELDERPADSYERIDPIELSDDAADVSFADIVDSARDQLAGVGIVSPDDADDPDDLKLAGIRFEFVGPDGIQRTKSLEAPGYEPDEYHG